MTARPHAPVFALEKVSSSRRLLDGEVYGLAHAAARARNSGVDLLLSRRTSGDEKTISCLSVLCRQSRVRPGSVNAASAAGIRYLSRR